MNNQSWWNYNNPNQQSNYYNNIYGIRNQTHRREYAQPYAIPIFNNIHNYFPALLYEHERFATVTSLLTYIRDQVRYHSDTFLNAQRDYLYGSGLQPVQPPAQPPIAAPAPATAPRTPVIPIAPNIRLGTTAADQQFLNSLLNIFAQPDLTLMTGIFNLPEPVVVSPSNEVLSNASDILTATADHSGVQCMVCLEHLVAGQELRKLRFCRHVFHRSCIDTWFERTVRCPICRHDVRDDLHVDENNTETEEEEEPEDTDVTEID
jgi:hypothetical protein